MKSQLLKKGQACYREMAGQEAAVTAIHAGLECSFLSDKLKGSDILSFGPDIEGPHSPSEKVKISSVQKMYDFAKKLVEQLA